MNLEERKFLSFYRNDAVRKMWKKSENALSGLGRGLVFPVLWNREGQRNPVHEGLRIQSFRYSWV